MESHTKTKYNIELGDLKLNPIQSTTSSFHTVPTLSLSPVATQQQSSWNVPTSPALVRPQHRTETRFVYIVILGIGNT